MACYGNSEYEDSVSESESNSEAKLIKFQQVIREKNNKMRRNMADSEDERSPRCCQEGRSENMEFVTSSMIPRFRKHSRALGVDRKIVRFATLTSCNLKTVLRNQMKLFNPNSTHHFLQHIKK